ncbi:GSCOCG00010700001-RA-CDS, partial [Cotesia congregata]
TTDEETLGYDYKLRAVEYWRSGKKKNLTALDAGMIVHDSDLQKWALQAKKSIEFDDFRFQASKKWLLDFKKAHRIVSRKINKFVTSKTIGDKKILMEKSKEFVGKPSGKFSPVVKTTLFKTDNVYAVPSKSGKLTSVFIESRRFEGLTKLRFCIYFGTIRTSRFWKIAKKLQKNFSKNLEIMIIPKGITGNIQPLDVFGFRIWKNFVKHFSDSVILMGQDLNLHLRNNIIKLQSLTHNQLSSPRYRDLFKYSWFKSGYVE